MTRETRIGLLVGLVFIVMFGLVLSGLTESKNTLPAKPAVAVDNNYPAQTLMAYEEPMVPTPAVAPGTLPATAPRPTDQMATTAAPDSGPAAVVHISINPLPPDPPAPVIPTAMVTPAPGTGAVTPPATLTAPTTTDGDAIVPPVAEPPSVVASGGGRVYVVEDKDSFIKIARKLYGPTHVGDYKKIMDANKVKDPASLKPGTTLTIPPLAGVPAPAAVPTPTAPAAGRAVGATPAALPGTVRVASGTTGRPAAVPAAITPTSAPAPAVAAIRVRLGATADPRTSAAAPGRTPTTVPAALAGATPSGRSYVVQKGDTLSSIARKQLSSDSRTNIEKLAKLNKIESAVKLQVGMKLEIPS